MKNQAFVVFDARHVKLGELVDIGPDGLAFRYLVEGVENVDDTMSIDLIMGTEDFYLDRLPVAVVANREDKTLPFATILTRIAVLRFGRLSPEQKFRLGSFLDRHTASTNV